MPKNIIIFSDGTGQAGGIKFDEARTNVYKLYRACRIAPDTSINPTEQVAFYDAGLGSAATLVYANAGPPQEARSITGKMFSQSVHIYKFGSGKIRLEAANTSQVELIVPDPSDKPKGEE